MDKYNLRLGYSSICNQLRNLGIFSSRGMIRNSLNKPGGLIVAKNLALKNIQDLQKIIIWNETQGIRLFRITSQLFPHLDDDETPKYDINFAIDLLKETGKIAKSYGHRITMHPGQHNILNSPNDKIVNKTINELVNHAKILMTMGYKPEHGSVIVIHVGGVYGDKPNSLNRWKKNWYLIPEFCRKYIVIENDEFSYNVMDVLNLSEELNIPMVLDFFHNEVSNDKVKITNELLLRIAKTWKNITPKFHYSVQLEGERRGSHGKTIDFLPLMLLKLPQILQQNVDCILEVKDKESSVLKNYRKYFKRIEIVNENGYGKIDWHLI